MLARAGDSSTAPVTSFARRHPGAIARPALLRRLDDAPGRVVAIEAPPGTGKRTLAAAWLRQSPVNRGCIESHDGRGVDAVARWLLTHGDLGSRLLVVSETPVPRSITTRGGVLRAGDLAFTADEIGALLNALGLRVSPTFVTALLEVTDGWAAAVDIGLRHLASETGGGFDAMLTALRAYALRSVIAPLPDDLARSLERMALGRYADGDDARATRSLVERQLVLASPGRNTLRVHPYLAWALRTTNTADAPHAAHTVPTSRVARAVPVPFATVGVAAAPAFVRPPLAARRRYRLTRREGEVLVHLSSDVNTREIAHAMCVSRDTVKSHVRNIYRKLGVASRDDAVAAARTAGILEPQDVR